MLRNSSKKNIFLFGITGYLHCTGLFLSDIADYRKTSISVISPQPSDIPSIDALTCFTTDWNKLLTFPILFLFPHFFWCGGFGVAPHVTAGKGQLEQRSSAMCPLPPRCAPAGRPQIAATPGMWDHKNQNSLLGCSVNNWWFVRCRLRCPHAGVKKGAAGWPP